MIRNLSIDSALRYFELNQDVGEPKPRRIAREYCGGLFCMDYVNSMRLELLL